MAKKTKEVLRAIMPNYTLGEELVSSISHGIGALLGVAALVLCVVKSALSGSAIGVVSSAIYGFSLILLYTMSTLYHALKMNNAKYVFRIFDHCSIFLLIAGTYTPISLVGLGGALGWVIFGIVWGASVLGITLNAIDVKKYRIFSMICYLACGWCIVFAMKPLLEHIGKGGGLTFLLVGGILYTIGAVFYGLGKKKRYIHSLWHFFVLGGSILHFFCIFLYVL